MRTISRTQISIAIVGRPKLGRRDAESSASRYQCGANGLRRSWLKGGESQSTWAAWAILTYALTIRTV